MQKCDANLSEEEIQNWTKFNNDSEDPGRIGFAELQSEYYKWYDANAPEPIIDKQQQDLKADFGKAMEQAVQNNMGHEKVSGE